jgi:GGDEF domain-containing protein
VGWLVAIIGLVHVAMGFGAAVWLARRLPAAAPAHALALRAAEAAPPAPPPEPSPPPPPREGDFAPAWLDKLNAAAAEHSFGKAAMRVLRLDVGRYREQLVQIDERLRSRDACPEREALGPVLAQLQKVNQAWLADHGQALEQLAGSRSELGKYAPLAEQLEALLLQQAAQIESTCTNLAELSAAPDARALRLQVQQEVCRVLDLVHRLRDELHAVLLAIVLEEGWLASLDRKLLLDPVLQIPNRVGLVAALERWWREDPSRCRLASMAMMNIDALRAVNLTHGRGWRTACWRAWRSWPPGCCTGGGMRRRWRGIRGRGWPSCSRTSVPSRPR